MLRWLTETDRQNALRAQYYASRHLNDANHTHEHEQANNNARSAGSSSRVNLSSSQRSVGSGRTHSISSNRRSHDVSPQKRVPDLVIPRRGWRYTVDDIQAFRDSGGVVNYFVPPRQVRPFNDDDADEDEEEKSVSPQTIANRVEHGLNKTYGHQRATTPQSQSKDIDRHRDDNSSAAGSSKKGHLYEFSSRTANNTASNVSLADMDQSMREANLSRSTSFDTGGDKSVSRRRDHRVRFNPPPLFFFVQQFLRACFLLIFFFFRNRYPIAVIKVSVPSAIHLLVMHSSNLLKSSAALPKNSVPCPTFIHIATVATAAIVANERIVISMISLPLPTTLVLPCQDHHPFPHSALDS